MMMNRILNDLLGGWIVVLEMLFCGWIEEIFSLWNFNPKIRPFSVFESSRRQVAMAVIGISPVV